MSAVSFAVPEADAAEARARADEPGIRELARALARAVTDCAVDPEGGALDEKPVLKAVRAFCHYLTGLHGEDSVRAGFRQSLRRLADLRETRIPFLLADGTTVLWFDLFPADGVRLYVDPERSTPLSRARWARVVPPPGRVVPCPSVERIIGPARAEQPSKRYDAGEVW